jgi:hypothetical protein
MTDKTEPETPPAAGDEWASWGRQDTEGDVERWKPSGHVGQIVQLTIRGYKLIPATQYGDWEFIEADVDEVATDGHAYASFAEVPLSGAWFLNRFKAAPSGYRALGVITKEEFAKGTGYAMRSLTEEERALVAKLLPTY